MPPSMGSFGVCQVTLGQGPGGGPWEHPAVLRDVLSSQPAEYPPHLGPQIYTASLLCIQVHDFIQLHLQPRVCQYKLCFFVTHVFVLGATGHGKVGVP